MEFSKCVIYGVTLLVMFSCLAGAQLASGKYLAINFIVLQLSVKKAKLLALGLFHDMFSCYPNLFTFAFVRP